jgi:hypothetical protein
VKRYTVMVQRHRTTLSKHGRNKAGMAFPATEWRSSVGLPQFDLICETARDAIYKASWILDTRDELTTHTFTVTDGDSVWDETGKELGK